MASVFLKCVLIASFTSSLFACRIWGIIAKSDGDFSTLSLREKSIVTEELQRLYEQSAYHPAGWALLGINPKSNDPIALLERSPDPADQNAEQYWNAANALLTGYGTTMGIGHVRMATSGISSIPNPHPWIFQSELGTFSLSHNGTISKSILYDLITENGTDKSWLNQHSPQTFDTGNWEEDGWNAVVDSELMLLLIMKHIEIKKSAYYGLLSALTALEEKGASTYQTNIVFSDERSLYVYGGRNRLSVAESSEHFAVMSGPPISGEAGALNWSPIEHGELVILSADGMKRIPDFTKKKTELYVKAKKFKVLRAFPNPFNSYVIVDVEIPEDEKATYAVYNLAGKLVSYGIIPSRKQSMQWHPENRSGNPLPSGSYVIRITAGGKDIRQKVLYLK
ncbi:MAG: T9SS type A sorting domain-containing protein [Candidatus Marinimicrobia bacterium]|jgi:predicted glutamine amidotransferase|nr:T9SS type A sorting domain-containing protein [Candidatus Neomarinimicrobiota bacterium]